MTETNQKETNQKEIKLIAFDLDGTFLTGVKEVSARNRRAVEEAIQKGVVILAATGRPLGAVPPEVWDFPGIRFYMSSNGASIWDQEKEDHIRKAYLSREQAILVYSAGQKEHVWREICIDGTCYAQAEQFKELKDYVASEQGMEYLMTTRNPVEDLGEILMHCPNKIERVSYFSYEIDRLERIREAVRDIPDLAITSAIPQDLEIGHKMATKEAAIAYFCESLGIEMAEVMAIGDGRNDLGMIETAGIGVAVENATEEVKAGADYVTDSNDKDGVGKAIEKFVL